MEIANRMGNREPRWLRIVLIVVAVLSTIVRLLVRPALSEAEAIKSGGLAGPGRGRSVTAHRGLLQNSRNPLVQVPAAALLWRPSGPQVARVDASGRISFREVTIGRDDGSVVELASGASPGDRLALNVSSQIVDGEKVRVQQNEAGDAAPVAAARR